MNKKLSMFLLMLFGVGAFLNCPAIGRCSESFGGSQNILENSIIPSHKLGVGANRESTKRSAFILYNHGKKTMVWGIERIFSHSYNWAKSINDYLNEFNEIIAMIVSSVVFFIEFWVNAFAYYLIGVVVAIYGLVACIVGIILVPVIAIWNFFLWVLSFL